MTIKQAIWGDNTASPNTHFEWGPTTLTDVYKLLRVKIDISFGFPGTNLTPTALLVATAVWGVQYVTSGDPPLGLPGDLSSYQYLIGDLTVGDSTGVAAWTPPTNDVGVITFATLSREWYGNRVIEGNIDLWVNFATFIAGAGDLAASWMMRVDWV